MAYLLVTLAAFSPGMAPPQMQSACSSPPWVSSDCRCLFGRDRVMGLYASKRTHAR